ncbi:hypothetical protein SALBM311S_05888 [Streptomyces alboniger]
MSDTDAGSTGVSAIGLFLLLTMTKRVSVLVALVLLPVLAALVGGFAGDLGEIILTGLTTVAPTGIMRSPSRSSTSR